MLYLTPQMIKITNFSLKLTWSNFS